MVREGEEALEMESRSLWNLRLVVTSAAGIFDLGDVVAQVWRRERRTDRLMLIRSFGGIGASRFTQLRPLYPYHDRFLPLLHPLTVCLS